MCKAKKRVRHGRPMDGDLALATPVGTRKHDAVRVWPGVISDDADARQRRQCNAGHARPTIGNARPACTSYIRIQQKVILYLTYADAI